MRRNSIATLFLALMVTAICQAEELQPLRDGGSGRLFAIRVSPTSQAPAAGGGLLSVGDRRAAANAFITANKAMLGLADPAKQLSSGQPDTDILGQTHVRYHQHHLGLPVLGGELQVHLTRGGAVYYVSSKVATDLPGSVTPLISESRARGIALDWAALLTTRSCESGSARLLILPLGIVKNQQECDSRLAWEIQVQQAGEGDNYSARHFIDAMSGEQLLVLSNIHALDRRVFDCSLPNNTSCYLDYYVSSYGYTFGRSESAPSRGPCPVANPVLHGRADVDTLHPLLRVTHNYWLDTFGLNGGNGHGGIGVPPSRPAESTIAITLADEENPDLCPGRAWYQDVGRLGFCAGEVTPDVVGHEYGHSVVHNAVVDTAGAPLGMIYWGESGALDESFADLAGEAIELRATGLHDWRQGVWQSNPAGAYPSSDGGLSRDLSNPGSLVEPDGSSYPDRFYSPNMYCGELDHGGVHTNSTILSHVLYLLSEGGELSGCHVDAIGFEAVQQIAYRALTTYYTQTTTFNEAYAAYLQAAADLYSSDVVIEVRVALQAAQLDQPGLCSGLAEQTPECVLLTGVGDVPVGDGSTVQSAAPNPAEGRVNLQYRLVSSGSVRVTVYDVRGRLVAEPLDQWQEPGDQQVIWNGRMQGEMRAAPGVYFLYVTVNGREIGTRRVMVLH
jgi:Zn-dependent metalloprotease